MYVCMYVCVLCLVCRRYRYSVVAEVKSAERVLSSLGASEGGSLCLPRYIDRLPWWWKGGWWKVEGGWVEGGEKGR